MSTGDRLAPGAPLGGYTIQNSIGQGGFGITYLAKENTTGRAVAIKEYFPFYYAERRANGAVAAKRGLEPHFAKFWEDFRKEALALSRFDHPNIVHVLARFDANNTSYFVMEFIKGEQLAAVVERSGPLSAPAVMLIAENLVEGVKTVHDQGLLHRDVKPGNIILASILAPRPTRLNSIPQDVRLRFGKPVLLDFGAARVTTAGGQPMTGIFSPGFGPLEQSAEKGVQDARADIYGLGATLYYCLAATQLPPATERDKQDTLQPAARRFAGLAPPGFLAAIDKALSLRAEHRHRDIRAFRTALLSDANAALLQVRDNAVSPDHSPTPRPIAPVRLEVSVFARKRFRVGDEETIYVVAHRPGVDPRAALAEAPQSSGDARHTLGALVEADGARIDAHVAKYAWHGDHVVIAIPVIAESFAQRLHIQVRVLFDDAQLATLTLERPVNATSNRRADLERIKLRNHKRVYLSFARGDRDAVQPIVATYTAAGVEVLGPWNGQRRLTSTDCLHLCWSSAAAASLEVEQDVGEALALRRVGKGPPLTVQLLDGPPAARKPPGLGPDFDRLLSAGFVGKARSGD